MAYRFIDKDGDEAIKYEHGMWDSVMGYWCKICSCYLFSPAQAETHENDHIFEGDWGET